MLSSLLSGFSSTPSPSQAPAATAASVPSGPEPLVLLPATRTDLARLRVKIKSLAAEARIIRQEEHRALRLSPENPDRLPRYRTLREHRKQDVRAAARAALLAYAFLRGRAYATVERPNTITSPALPNIPQTAVLNNILRFSPTNPGCYRHPRETWEALQEQLRRDVQKQLREWVTAPR